ncbi:hypothetical protein RJ640_020656 [Escallonia rubra]|uniref:Protein FAR1-RELATED SEQUENCE n=1 Tax=Escallonia rubra TaxID=112253 RepID=A0AA88RES1_9ASTE|nr:hypothetical protein RJ640_020656 [Escallonia rubra]
MDFEPLNLDNEVIEFDMGSAGEEDEDEEDPGLDLEQPFDYDDNYVHNMADNSTEVHNFPSSLNGDPILNPYEGMEFDSEQAARNFYNSYARRTGFSTRVSVYQRSRRDGSIICRQVVCSREGFRREGGENKSKRQRTVTRVGCKAQMTVKKQSSGKWAVTKLVKEHNHNLVPPDKVHCLRSHRHVSGPARSLIDTLQAAGMGPSGVMSVLIKESGGINNVGFTKVDCQNYMSSSRLRTLGTGVVAQVLPGIRHRFCKWNIFREAQEKLSHVYHSCLTFEVEFQKCVNLSETVEEFESCWESLLMGYNLRDNEWLQSMYNVRQQWVPVYLRDTFFGEMSITLSSDSINSFFDGYINASTSIHVLIKQYEKAMISRYEREVKADYDTINTAPILKTPSPMEKQAANLYTRKIFTKFQEELVETLANPAIVINDTGLEIMYRDALREAAKKVFDAKQNLSGVVRGGRINEGDQEVNTKESQSAHLQSYSVEHGDVQARAAWLTRLNFGIRLGWFIGTFIQVSPKFMVCYDSNFDLGRNPLVQVETQDKEVEELTTELERANQRCEAYRTKLLAILKDMEEQKLKISVRVQNVRLGCWS